MPKNLHDILHKTLTMLALILLSLGGLLFAAPVEADIIHYNIYFDVTNLSGTADKLGIQGSFDYNDTTPEFSNFFVTYTSSGTFQDPMTSLPSLLTVTQQVDTFDMTALANGSWFSSGWGGLTPPLGLVNTPADTFRLITKDFPSGLVISGNIYTPRYWLGGSRIPHSGSQLGEGFTLFGVNYCALTCESFGIGTGPTGPNNDPPLNNFTTTVLPYGTEDGYRILNWNINANYLLSPFPITNAAPEPATYTMLLAGLAMLGFRRRIRNSHSPAIVGSSL